jgi:hypothetical protein
MLGLAAFEPILLFAGIVMGGGSLMAQEYQRIIYPERAEYLAGDSVFNSYRIFLDHWSDITAYLQESFEVLRVRRFSRGLIIYGKQGCGKSLLANKLTGDFGLTKAQIRQLPAFQRENIWHRICGGSSGSVETVVRATEATVVLQVENKSNWISEAEKIVQGNPDRACLVIADNCERDYFLKGLLNVTDEAYLRDGRTSAALKAAAHRFVELCRSSLRGCFFLFFTNDEDFALAFDQHVNDQHKGLVDIRDLKMPNDLQKEAIVRINVNRLNNFSYWLCIDRAGPSEKAAVWNTLKGAETFPAAFNAVDNAIRSSTRSREGRPARKCILNAFTFVNAANVAGLFSTDPTSTGFEDIYAGQNFCIRLYEGTWHELFGSTREYKMLASEWHLKVILAGDAAVAALLAGSDLAKQLVQQATIYHGAGTQHATRDAYAQALGQLDAAISVASPSSDNAIFWAKGIVRNHDYETALKAMFPTYNTKSGGFLTARPDLVLYDYVPCSVLRATTSDVGAINDAVRRGASVVEFTAIKEFTFPKLAGYLIDHKLRNYIATVQEQ